MASTFIRSGASAGKAIADGAAPTANSYFRLLRLAAGARETFTLEAFECLAVVLSGSADILVGDECFAAVGKRRDIWAGKADSVYCGRAKPITISARGEAEVALAGCRSSAEYPAFRITPDEVDMVEVGSPETHSRRRIFHILGHNGAGRTGNLLVSELYADAGCWSGYPPHKHDTDDGENETAHEEIYHYRFDPPTGFGAQYCYERDETGRIADARVHMTRDGDTFCFDGGYHPTAASPGHAEYIFTILVGKTRRPLIQRFDAEHAHLVDNIPGIAAMRAKFR